MAARYLMSLPTHKLKLSKSNKVSKKLIENTKCDTKMKGSRLASFNLFT